MPPQAYEAGRPVHVVIGCRRGVPAFRDPRVARVAFDPLADHLSTLAAVVMPTHVHWLLSDCATLLATVGRYKSYVATTCRRLGFEGPLWQRSFWDHVVRSSEKLDLIARYVVENPIRAGLCQRYEDYLFAVVFPERIADLR